MNKMARKTNNVNVRKAELEEKKRNIMAAKAPSTDSGATFLDPFARVKTRAKVYHNGTTAEGGEKDKDGADIMDDLFGSDTGTPANLSRAGTPGVNGLGASDVKVPSLLGNKRTKGVDDVIASLGCAIDIEI